MTGNKCLSSRSVVRKSAPVALKPLRFFAKRFSNIREPRANHKAIVEASQQIDPTFYGVHRNLNFLCKAGINKLLGTSFCKDLHQGFHGSQVRHARHIAQVFARQLLLSQRSPTPCETAVAVEERLWKPAVLPQGLPIRS